MTKDVSSTDIAGNTIITESEQVREGRSLYIESLYMTNMKIQIWMTYRLKMNRRWKKIRKDHQFSSMKFY